MKTLYLALLIVILAAVIAQPVTAARSSCVYMLTRHDAYMVDWLSQGRVFVPGGSEVYNCGCSGQLCRIYYGLWVIPPVYDGWIGIQAFWP